MASYPPGDGAMKDPDHINRLLDDVWRKVQSAGTDPRTKGGLAGDFVSAERDLLQDTLEQWRRRFLREKQDWSKVLEERDQLIRSLRSEKAQMETQLAGLKEEWNRQRSEQQTMDELETVGRREWESQLRGQIDGFQNEIQIYREQIHNLEEARQKDMDRHKKAEARWREMEEFWRQALEKRDQDLAQVHAQLREFQGQRQEELRKTQEERGQQDADRKKDMAAAEESVQKAQLQFESARAEADNLQHLLDSAHKEIARLSHDRDQMEMELKMSRDEAGRLTQEISSLREAWETERAHWRELWEKERSSRERWMEEMRGWEDHLRRERETWLKQFTAEQEAKQEMSQKVDRTIEHLRRVSWSIPETERPKVKKIPVDIAAVLSAWKTPRALWTGGAVVSLMLTASLWVNWAFSSPSEFAMPTAHASGLAVRGDKLWFSDWMSGQILQTSQAKPSDVLFAGSPSADEHPVALTLAGDRLWSLDSWGNRLGEHQSIPPFASLRFWPLPQQVPVDLAWDGQGVWILDRSKQILRRYDGQNNDHPDREVSLPPGWSLTALDCLNGEFWGFDSAAQKLRRFVLAPQVLVKAEYRLPIHEKPGNPLTALRVMDKTIWSMSEKSQTVYRWSRRQLNARLFLSRIAG